MDTNDAISALGALAQHSRLAAFRLLVRAAPDGLPAGEIAAALQIPHNTLSAHLTTLGHAGLVSARRDGRRMLYRVELDQARALLAFLLEDCCGGVPELCDSALESIATCCGAAPRGVPS
ncbi:MAG: metalloregulator ArsR/SmtB family transcription factor [Pseudomonadales bacterium]|jgi:DNA-binding transcriptional ArsR family regulator|nr:metalloregulator ArsR/SmtB family transcription factor [Pseudomonadales bacterium]